MQPKDVELERTQRLFLLLLTPHLMVMIVFGLVLRVCGAAVEMPFLMTLIEVMKVCDVQLERQQQLRQQHRSLHQASNMRRLQHQRHQQRQQRQMQQ